jgi:ribonucleoside-diphosphate reductase beta chain
MSIKNSPLLINPNAPECNQLWPVLHPYFAELYKNGEANNWSPAEISMKKDRDEWNSDFLSKKEKKLVETICELFCVGESIISNNIGSNIFKYINNGEARQYFARHMLEEAVHNQTIVHLIEAFSLDPNKVYYAYEKSPSVKAFAEHMRSIRISCNDLKLDKEINTKDLQTFCRLLVNYYLLCEGLFFYGCFAAAQSFGRQGKLRGMTKLFYLNSRDEQNHLNSGIYLINTLVKQHPEIWKEEFKEILVKDLKDGLTLSYNFNRECLPSPLLGLSAEMLNQYLDFLVFFRAESIGLNGFEKASNPFPWLSEANELPETANFFEEKVIAYKHKSVLQDDF